MAQPHLHTGAVNATFSINGKTMCFADTHYGTDSDETTNARNEQNHLIMVDSCYDTAWYKNGGIEFDFGDILTSESFYNGASNDDRFVGGAGGEHQEVMSVFHLFINFYD